MPPASRPPKHGWFMHRDEAAGDDPVALLDELFDLVSDSPSKLRGFLRPTSRFICP